MPKVTPKEESDLALLTFVTKIKLIGWGWVYVHVVLDWYTKEIIGTSVSHTSKTNDWLDALNIAVCQRFPHGIHLNSKKTSLITDNGCQPTSTMFMKDCAILGIKQIFTTWNNPKGNADTERVFRTMKEDLVWPNEWHLPFQLYRLSSSILTIQYPIPIYESFP